MCSQDKFNPRDAKIDLAHELVERFHGHDKADKAKSNFISRFQNKNITDDIPLIELKTAGELRIIDLIIKSSFATLLIMSAKTVKLASITSLFSLLFDIFLHEPEPRESKSNRLKKRIFFLIL